MKKRIYLGGDARNSILPGFRMVSDLVRSIYGPRGRTVLSTQVTGQPHAAVKALDIAKSLEVSDPGVNAGICFARALCEEVNEAAGDGAATSVIICSDLLSEGARHIASGTSPVLLKQGIMRAVHAAADHISTHKYTAQDRESILNTASTAAADRSVGCMVCDALESVGWNGSLSVRASETSECRIQHEDGLCFDRGYCSPYMSTDRISMEAVFTDASVFVCESRIDRIDDILPLLNEASISGASLLLVAQDYSEKVLQSMLSNISQETIKLCAVKAPGHALGRRDLLEDIAAYTGTVVFGTEVARDPRQASLKKCGRAKKVKVTRDSTTLYNDVGTSLDTYVAGLKSLLNCAPNMFVRESLEDRIANLTGGRAVIRIGAPTGIRYEALTAMYNSAIHAARSAMRGGIVTGGGTAYIRAVAAVKELCVSLDGDTKAGALLVSHALTSPLRQLAANAGINGSVVVNKLTSKDPSIVFDAVSQSYCRYDISGLVDAAETEILALTKAASMAAEILTVEAMVLPDVPPKKKEAVPESLKVDPRDLL